MPDPSDLLASVGDLLDHLADLTGDSRFAHAAGILAGRPVGRRAIDDGQALALVKSMVAAGLVRSKNAACTRAANFYAPTWGVDAMRARLMRKLRTE